MSGLILRFDAARRQRNCTRPACQQCGGSRVVWQYDPDADVTRFVRCPSCNGHHPQGEPIDVREAA